MRLRRVRDRGRGPEIALCPERATSLLWRTPGAHLDGKRRESWGRCWNPEGPILQAFPAFSCPALPAHSHPQPPRQGGGHWFEPSIAHDGKALLIAGFLRLMGPKRRRSKGQRPRQGPRSRAGLAPGRHSHRDTAKLWVGVGWPKSTRQGPALCVLRGEVRLRRAGPAGWARSVSL
jgi:hypothetical protein